MGKGLPIRGVVSLSVTMAFLATSLILSTGGQARASSGATIQAWVYPTGASSPSCDVPSELSHIGVNAVSTVKPEYLDINGDGRVVIDNASEYPCNGFDSANLALLQKYASSVVVTVSAGGTQVAALLKSSFRRSNAVATISSFITNNQLAGADIDFEPGIWSPTLWKNFLLFVASLHTSLGDLTLEVDLAAYQSTPGDSTNYQALAATGSTVVVMAYDDEFNSRCGAITPFSWLERVVRYAQSRVPSAQLVVGLPAYGYSTTDCRSYRDITTNVAYTTMQAKPGFPATALQVARDRARGSDEIRWTDRGVHYDFVDSVSLTAKISFVESLGISSISIWSLGGEPWITGDPPAWS